MIEDVTITKDNKLIFASFGEIIRVFDVEAKVELSDEAFKSPVQGSPHNSIIPS